MVLLRKQRVIPIPANAFSRCTTLVIRESIYYIFPIFFPSRSRYFKKQRAALKHRQNINRRGWWIQHPCIKLLDNFSLEYLVIIFEFSSTRRHELGTISYWTSVVLSFFTNKSQHCTCYGFFFINRKTLVDKLFWWKVSRKFQKFHIWHCYTRVHGNKKVTRITNLCSFVIYRPYYSKGVIIATIEIGVQIVENRR